jgi:hypothetical protein
MLFIVDYAKLSWGYTVDRCICVYGIVAFLQFCQRARQVARCVTNLECDAIGQLLIVV